MTLCFSLSAQNLPDSLWVNWRLAGPQVEYSEPILTILPALFGAVGDGVTDDTESILRSIDACGDKACQIILGEGTFRISQGLSLRSHQHLIGKGSERTLLLFDMGDDPSPCIQMLGQAGQAYGLSQSAPQGSHLIPFPEEMDIEAGDYLEFFEQNQNWDSSPADWAEESVGQILQVKEVLDDGRIETYEKLRFALNPAHEAGLRKVFPVVNAGLSCLSMRREEAISSGIGAGIYMKYAVESKIEGVESSQSMGSHILVEASAHNLIRGNYIHHAFEYNGSATHGYGITLLSRSSDNLIEDNVLHTLRHALMVKQGANGNVFAHNYSFEPYREEFPHDLTGDISLHGHYPFANLFEGNIVQNIIIDHYWGPSGPSNMFFRNLAQDYGIVSANFSMEDVQTTNQVFVGNVISSKEFLKGMFLLGGENWTYANRISSESLSSTEIPLDTLSFYTDEPNCWASDLAWPAIDPRMDMHELSNPAWQRVQDVEVYTNCGCEKEVEEITTSVEENVQSDFSVSISIREGTPILRISTTSPSFLKVHLWSVLGQGLVEKEYQLISGENRISFVQLEALAVGLYYFSLHSGTDRKILKWVKD